MSANGILRLGELVAERRPVEITRGGETVTLQGYVGSVRCPLSVRAEVESAERVWRAVIKDRADSDFSEIPFRTYMRDAVLAIVPGLEFTEAEILASNFEASRGLLRYLEWWTDPAETSATEAQDENPPAEAATPMSTGERSRRRSQPSTPSALVSS